MNMSQIHLLIHFLYLKYYYLLYNLKLDLSFESEDEIVTYLDNDDDLF